MKMKNNKRNNDAMVFNYIKIYIIGSSTQTEKNSRRERSILETQVSFSLQFSQ